jgi:hypothetical protein
MLLVQACGKRENRTNYPGYSIVKTYFPNGGIMGVVTYHGEVQYGLAEYFYQNGKLRSKAYFKNNVRDGLSIAYTEDGTILAKGYYENGKVLGPSYTYFTNGKAKQFDFYGYDSILIHREYDETGKTIVRKGNTHPKYYLAGKNSIYSKGDIMNVTVVIAFPPELKVTSVSNCVSNIYDIDSIPKKDWVVQNVAQDSFRIYFEHSVPAETGMFYLRTLISYSDSLDRKLFMTSANKFEVK